jgi:hypothetical protein
LTRATLTTDNGHPLWHLWRALRFRWCNLNYAGLAKSFLSPWTVKIWTETVSRDLVLWQSH